jgi:Flp pilus assembly pilin Flp
MNAFIAATRKRGAEKDAGQTMTEYVLIIAAVAIVGYTAYVALGGGIEDLITTVTGLLSSS